MQLNNDQLQLLQRMGKNFFDLKKCATALEVDEAGFFKEMSDKSSPAFKAYFSGFLTSELKHREGVIEVAERGSNPAQQQVEKYIESASKHL